MAERCRDVVHWRRTVLASDLPPAAKVVAMVLHEHMTWNKDAADAGGSCFPGLDTIATEAGFARRTVTRALDELEAAELVARLVGGGRGKPTNYVAALPKKQGRHVPDSSDGNPSGAPPETGTTTQETGTSAQETGTTTHENRDDTSPDLPGTNQGTNQRTSAHQAALEQVERLKATHFNGTPWNAQEPEHDVDRERGDQDQERSEELKARTLRDCERWADRLRGEGVDEQTIARSCRQLAQQRLGDDPDLEAVAF